MAELTTTDRIIRKDEATRLTGLSSRSIDRREAAGDFPARVRLGPNSVGWRLSQITTWISSREPGSSAEETGG